MACLASPLRNLQLIQQWEYPSRVVRLDFLRRWLTCLPHSAGANTSNMMIAPDYCS